MLILLTEYDTLGRNWTELIGSVFTLTNFKMAATKHYKAFWHELISITEWYLFPLIYIEEKLFYNVILFIYYYYLF